MLCSLCLGSIGFHDVTYSTCWVVVNVQSLVFQPGVWSMCHMHSKPDCKGWLCFLFSEVDTQIACCCDSPRDANSLSVHVCICNKHQLVGTGKLPLLVFLTVFRKKSNIICYWHFLLFVGQRFWVLRLWENWDIMSVKSPLGWIEFSSSAWLLVGSEGLELENSMFR